MVINTEQVMRTSVAFFKIEENIKPYFKQELKQLN